MTMKHRVTFQASQGLAGKERPGSFLTSMNNVIRAFRKSDSRKVTKWALLRDKTYGRESSTDNSLASAAYEIRLDSQHLILDTLLICSL